MRYVLSLLILLVFTFSLNAVENANEFSEIKPIAVEEEPVFISTDNDGDGVLNENDQCPTTPKGEKVNRVGCPPDSDEDGVLDMNDKCPNTPKGERVDKDGCPLKKDSDKDGVFDDKDECPGTPLGIKVDEKGCELDSDEDGVVDSKDQCPDTSKEFKVDIYGCPKTATLKVNFDTDKYNVSDRLMGELETFAKFLKENEGYDVIIYGYTDSSGLKHKNQILSDNRAKSVKEALTRFGISASRFTTIGKGDSNPVADNATVEGRAQNRRIEVELIK